MSFFTFADNPALLRRLMSLFLQSAGKSYNSFLIVSGDLAKYRDKAFVYIDSRFASGGRPYDTAEI